MAKTTKKEADSTAKPAKASKNAAKSKTTQAKAVKPAKREKSANAKSLSKPAAKKTTKRITEKKGASSKTPRKRKTPVRAKEVDTSPAADVAATRPSPQEIAERAYYLFLERGGQHGSDVEDWLEAERQVTSPG